ncbi:c-type cytochrome [Enterovirga rhinocerotis]|uniref:Cytochrome c556 n=1 Tax=Enterovirga rhinocerotis TaxID=1339210 RepID=A0A4R7C860_9HYPH|nr:cytochrome c [Enterovirga rhinocerotis]TDR94403.1 cytochrome c556 [Enterovirga rhinocerotis]
MTRFVLTTAVLLGLATVVVAQTDPIAQRRDVMKGVGAATKAGVEMVKGETPFDLAKAQDVLKTYATAAETFHTYYPETSKTGGGTSASPKIWESPAEFKAKFDAWGADIRKAAEDTKDLGSFKASFGSVMRSCRGCHEVYRIKT